MAKKGSKNTKLGKVIDYNLAVAVSDRVTIENVRLISCNCSQTPNAGKGKHSLEINCNINTQVQKKKGHILVFPAFKLQASPLGTDKKEPDLVLEATFVIIYKAKSLDTLRQDNFEAFGLTNGVYNAWPYWREFVQNTVARMSLPPLTIPVFRLSPAKAKKGKTKKAAKKKTAKKTS